MKGEMPVNTVDAYIAAQPVELRAMLEHIRALIQSLAPHAEEVISYHIPCYKYHGMLVGFGTRKKGCSFYVMSNTLLYDYAKDLQNCTWEGSTLHLDPAKPLPVSLLKKLTRLRIKHNEERARQKQAAKPGKS